MFNLTKLSMSIVSLSLLVAASVSISASAKELSCLATSSRTPETKAVSDFLSDCQDDIDYPSADIMVSEIRTEMGMPIWKNHNSIDPLNDVVVKAVLDGIETDALCKGKQVMDWNEVRSWIIAGLRKTISDDLK